MLRGLVDELVSSRGLSGGGTWRFPTAQVLDLPHVILSLLLQLSESPTQCVHRPVGLNQLRQRRGAEHADNLPEAGCSTEDGSSDSDVEVHDSAESLSDWSDDDSGSDTTGGVEEHAAVAEVHCDKRRSEIALAWHDRAKQERAVEQGSVSTRMAEHVILSAGCASRSSSSGLTLSPCDLATVVERHHAETQAYISPWPYSTTTELTLVREISLILLGETGSIFRRVSDSGAQAFQMLPVQVLHLSPDALQAFVGPLILTANRLLRIRLFCSQHLSASVRHANDRSTCATVQAFASAVMQILVCPCQLSFWLLRPLSSK
eukprot:COSAG02_NODE_500_length_21069_cov_21.971865_3_plen_319_part_00